MGPRNLLRSEGRRGQEEEEEEVKQADNTVRHKGRCEWLFTYMCLDIYTRIHTKHNTVVCLTGL